MFEHFAEIEKREKADLSVNVKRNTIVDTILRKECSTCNSVMPSYVQHCKTSGYCVAYLDHYCPWVNNAIGFYNQKLFVLFNFYGLITLAMSGFILTAKLVSNLYVEKVDSDLTVLDAIAVCSVFAVYLGYLFVLVVLCDQITIILNRMRMLPRL